MAIRTRHVLGLDVSLSSTGVAHLYYDPAGGEWFHDVCTLPTAPTGNNPSALRDRMALLRTKVAEAATSADLIVIEGGAFMTKTAHAHTLAGVWWLIYDKLIRMETAPVVVIPPAQLKKFITGKGSAGKIAVAAEVARAWPSINIGNSGDICDALGLATIGAAIMGLPQPLELNDGRGMVLASRPGLEEMGIAV
mgnify:FL=1